MRGIFIQHFFHCILRLVILAFNQDNVPMILISVHVLWVRYVPVRIEMKAFVALPETTIAGDGLVSSSGQSRDCSMAL